MAGTSDLLNRMRQYQNQAMATTGNPRTSLAAQNQALSTELQSRYEEEKNSQTYALNKATQTQNANYQNASLALAQTTAQQNANYQQQALENAQSSKYSSAISSLVNTGLTSLAKDQLSGGKGTSALWNSITGQQSATTGVPDGSLGTGSTFTGQTTAPAGSYAQVDLSSGAYGQGAVTGSDLAGGAALETGAYGVGTAGITGSATAAEATGLTGAGYFGASEQMATSVAEGYFTAEAATTMSAESLAATVAPSVASEAGGAAASAGAAAVESGAMSGAMAASAVFAAITVVSQIVNVFNGGSFFGFGGAKDAYPPWGNYATPGEAKAAVAANIKYEYDTGVEDYNSKLAKLNQSDPLGYNNMQADFAGNPNPNYIDPNTLQRPDEAAYQQKLADSAAYYKSAWNV